MKRSTKIIIAIVVILGGLIIAGAVKKNKEKGVTPVEVAKVEKADLISKVSTNGKIEAKRKVDLSANVMGQIVNLAVREGDIVKKGDFLLQIDKAQLAASAAGAEASVRALLSDRDAANAQAEEARLALERAQRSYADRVIPKADIDRAQAAWQSARANAAAIENRIAQARASLAGARDTLSKTTIEAPMSGIVTALPVEEGEVAVVGTMNNPGTILMTISDMSVVEAVMEVDETDVPTVKVGQKAKVTVDAYPNRTFDGVVTEVGTSPIQGAQQSSTDAINFEVRVQVLNPPAEVRPGFSVSADIITGTSNGVVAVPIQALVVREKPAAGKGDAKPVERAQEEEGVYVFDSAKGTVKFTAVKTGITGETSIEVVSGLKGGEQIVTGPFKALREINDDSKVKELKKEGEGKGKGDKKA